MVTTTDKQVAEKVAIAIFRADKTKGAVASAVGIPSTTFSRKMRGQSSFTVAELVEIARVTCQPLPFFIAGLEEARQAA